MTVSARFNAKIDKRPSGCWLWCGARDGFGYGLLAVSRRNTRAHRVAWMLHRGVIPDGLCVLHRCDTPACVNPEHLFIGTRADNNVDKARKGRAYRPIGDRNPKTKLRAGQVLRIRRDTRSQQAIADEFGVAQTLVSKIKRGVLWSHLT